MTLFTRSLWPHPVERPFLRLIFALMAAPLVLAAVLTGLAYLFAGSTEATRAETMAVTNEAAMSFFLFLPAYSLTVGMAGVVLLWRLALPGIIIWNAVGAVAGFLAALVLALATGRQIDPVHLAIAAVLSLVLFFLVRAFARVRSE